MTSRKMSLFEFWRRTEDRGAVLRRAERLRLRPPQQRRLLGDSGVRAALQSNKMASLLPPVGTEVFRRFTPASQQIQRQEEEEQLKTKDEEVAESDPPKPASDLEAGKPLPFIYGDPPPELLHTPLEELDPFYQSQKTFILLSKGNIIHRFNADRSLYLLSPLNPLRTAAIKIFSHSVFRLVVMVTVLTNCVVMTLSDPPGWTWTVEHVFSSIYTSETIIKVVSTGFCCGRFTFLRDPWNWLDLLVVSTAHVSQFVDLGKGSVLRTVPRVLKILALSPGLRMAVGAVVHSVKRLVGVLVLTLASLSFMALMGVQLFMGHLRNKCVMTFGNLSYFAGYHDNGSEHHGFNFNKYISSPDNHYYLDGERDALLCGNSSDAGVCPEGFVCLKTKTNPSYGFTSYDSFGWSLLSMFRLMTQDFWDKLVQSTLRASGTHYLIFFVLGFLACFCLLSLLVAVVVMATGEREEAAVAEAKRQEEEFSQILEVLKRSEEEERAEKQDGEHTAEEPEEDQRSCPPCWLVFDLVPKWTCCGGWRWLKQRLYTFIMNPFFDLGIVVLLILNTIFLAMEHYPMTEESDRLLSETHRVFTAIFTAEMVVKLVALDPYGYFQVGWNIYDSIIVVLSLLEQILADVSGLSSLFPVQMRVLRLARWWPSFLMWMKTIWTSVRAVRNLTVVLLVVVFSFTVGGMQLFQKDYKDCVCRISSNCELPRWHMNDFFHAFLVIVRVLYGQWSDIMWDCMEVSGQATCLIFFTMVVLIGNLLVLNLFLALLLSPFCTGDLPEKEKNNLHVALSLILRAVACGKTWILDRIWALLGKKNHVNPDHTAVSRQDDTRDEYLALDFLTSEQLGSKANVKALSGNHGSRTGKDPNSGSQRAPVAEAEAEIEIEVKTPENENEKLQQRRWRRFWSNFRRTCLTIVQHRYFDIFIIVIILLSSTALVFEDIHLQHRPVLQWVVGTADQVFTYLFLLEMLLKWTAFGLRKYFSDAWCWLDFLILDVSLVSLTADVLGISQLGLVQSLRTLRALGPLRTLSRFQGLRVVVQALVRTVLSMFHFLPVCLVVWFLLSITGVNLFAGKFYFCWNETSEEMFPPEMVDNKSQCFSLIVENFTEVRWEGSKLNYNNVLNGFLTLWHLATSADWMEPVYLSVDSRLIESQPVYEVNMSMYLYYVCLIIASFFTFNVFIRVTMDVLQRDKFGGRHLFMTEEQHKYHRTMMNRFFRKSQRPVPRPQNWCQTRLFDLVTSWSFEAFKLVLVCLNAVGWMVEECDQSAEMERVLYWFQFTFIVIFLAEVILKVTALRRHYFTNGWNVFDFVVTAASIVGVLVSDLVEKYFVAPGLFPLLRLAHICRILYLCRYTGGISKLLWAFLMSLPALFNLGLLLFLVTFTFSVFGMFNFAYVQKGAVIYDIFNFETFWSSVMCLFMIGPSALWGGLMNPIMDTPPDCDPHEQNPGWTVRGNCGSPVVGIVFVTSYILLSFLLVVHMYIAVLLETFSSEDAEPLCDSDLQMFYQTWTRFDPSGSQHIQYSQLSDFCNALQDPLRISKPNTIRLIHMDLPLLPGDQIHCVDVLLALAAQALGDAADVDHLKARLEQKFPTRQLQESQRPISSTLRRRQEEVAAAVIQRAFRTRPLQHGGTEEAVDESVDRSVDKSVGKSVDESVDESVDKSVDESVVGGRSSVSGSSHLGEASQ